ncbi:Uu.00g002360.m01.CDS01 [Anthostomella pinea]|uniref:Uu.00g002360.m01.CDS01 n=1 Tax=Anthostomella pinea TaxID=933095 RepID=A0AAI8YIH8_9PEZI|nr:Uu.00g002360.m01.CDS01 [Anthostomella pinea]
MAKDGLANGAEASSNGTSSAYSVPNETRAVFEKGILRNPLVSKHLLNGIEKFAAPVEFTGADYPSIPINWRFAESIASLKGLEAAYVNALVHKKSGLPPQKVVVDTDHAQLFIMSTLLWKIDPMGQSPLTLASFADPKAVKRFNTMFKSTDIHGWQTGLHRTNATNIYRTKDHRFFHTHGSLNPEPTLDMLGLPHRTEEEPQSWDEAIKPFVAKVGSMDSAELQSLAADKYRQAGTICWTPEEYRQSEHGKANADVGLWETERAGDAPASWWPEPSQSELTGPARPLGGLKVVDMTRIIAAPAITRGLAELGASVMRVAAPHLPDASPLHLDLNFGKWNTELDFRKEEDRQAMWDLILDADVFVQGYRPGVVEKWGFGADEVIERCKGRGRGIVVVRENCYGWHGPWKDRSGWQQISDACCGVSMEFGRAMGNDEPVTPVFPNSDYCTGVTGVCAVLDALIRRSEAGGSYKVDVALNYYSRWLVDTVGAYPPDVWDALWTKDGRRVFRHYHGMTHMLPQYMQMLMANNAATLFKPSYFEVRPCENLGTSISTVAPVLKFPEGNVKPGFHVGTRGNGVDRAVWPQDLLTPIVR